DELEVVAEEERRLDSLRSDPMEEEAEPKSTTHEDDPMRNKIMPTCE
ncbi:hypothetical protein Tco_1380137, partial [Tanacetum coccineum]